ncbi:hypothetical protein CISIN_1g0322982mg, partial [Citrus sinensis]
DLFVFTV